MRSVVADILHEYVLQYCHQTQRQEAANPSTQANVINKSSRSSQNAVSQQTFKFLIS